MRHLADPTQDFGPLFKLPERDAPNLSPSRLFFEGPTEDVGGKRERRLAGQLAEIFAELRSGEWVTSEDLSRKTGAPQASASAQLRHLRKNRWGAYVIQKEHLEDGLYRYRLALDQNGRPVRRETK